MNKRIITRWIVSAFYIVLGVTLAVCSHFGVADSFWGGMGYALAFVGALQTFRLIRYKTDTVYQEAVTTAAQDERNRFLKTKAWSWAGYLFVMIAAIATITFKLLEMETLMLAASGSICLLMILYWIAYAIICKKY